MIAKYNLKKETLCFLIIVLLLVFVNPFSLFSQDKAYEKAILFLHEDPSKAIVFGEEAYTNAKSKNDYSGQIYSLALISRAYSNLSNFDLAKKHIDSAQAINSRYGLNNIYPELVNAKVNYLQYEGDSKKTLSYIESLIKSAKKISDNRLLFELLSIQSNFLRQERNFEGAIEVQKEVLRIAETLNDSTYISVSYKNLGSLYFQLSQFETSNNWYEKARALSELKEDTIEIISIVRNISLINRDLGRFELANENLSYALDLAKKIKRKDLIAEILNLFGSLTARMGKPTDALEFYSQSLLIREELGFKSSTASTLENISRIQKELGLFEDATRSLQRSIKIRENLQDTRSLGSTFNELGNLFAEKGELADALMYYLKSLKIRQQLDIQVDIARSLTNIGLIYRRLGSHINAQKYFEQALELTSEKTNPLGKALIYIHIGNTLRDNGNSKEALSNYKKALELREQVGNKLSISQAMRSISNAYSDIENYSNAKYYLNQALKILRDINDEKSIADIYNELGNLAQKEKNDKLALEYFTQASSIYSKHFELDKKGLCIRKIGEIQTSFDKYDDALQSLKLALSLGESTGNAKLIELTHLALHNLYIKQNQHNNALQSYYEYIHIRDSLNTALQKEAIWQASLDLELNKKAEEIKAIESEVENLRTEAQLKTIQLEKQTLIRNFFAVVLVFVFLIALGSLYGYLLIRKKNSWLNEANEKLAASESDLKKLVQTKDKLFSIIAHDLRSPFTALVGLTEVLSNQAQKLDSSEVSEYGHLIHESSEKLLNLIDNLLQWSRSQTGKIKLVSKKINLFDLANDVIGILSLQAEAKKIRIVSTIGKESSFFADYDTVSTVIRNLISNAIKYTEQEGLITIGAYDQGNKVVIKITDNGVGIEKKNLDKLFKIEENFSTKGTKQEAGTGLGLIVCKEFVELNRGEISVESEVGKGTTFTFWLPSF